MLKQKVHIILILGVQIFFTLSFTFGGYVSAQNNIYKSLQTPFYDANGSGDSCSVSLDLQLSGNDNLEKSFNFFISKGLTQEQSAGIVGNMIHESGVDPENMENPLGRSKNPTDAGAKGWGIVQWTPANTKVPGIVSAAKIQGDVYELSTQLEMVWAQLDGKAGGYSEKQAGDELRSTTTIEEAVRAFQGDSAVGGKYRGYERPADQQGSIGRRIKNAISVKNLYGGQSAPVAANASSDAVVVDTPDSEGCATYTGPGQNTKYYDGFTVYSQYDPAWANKPYASSTISSSGCGPSAMAMIITALTGKQVTPVQTAQYAASKNLYIPGVGSKWTLASELAPNWGLKAKAIGTNVAAITAALQSGSLVIAGGKGPKPLTRSGHILVIRAVTADGKWLVGDSGNNDTSDKSWDPNQLLKSVSDGSVYAVSK